MAIIYLNGNRLSGLSSDPKPANPQDQAVLHTTDNGDLWDYDAGTSTWIQRSGSLSTGTLMAFT